MSSEASSSWRFFFLRLGLRLAQRRMKTRSEKTIVRTIPIRPACQWTRARCREQIQQPIHFHRHCKDVSRRLHAHRVLPTWMPCPVPAAVCHQRRRRAPFAPVSCPAPLA